MARYRGKHRKPSTAGRTIARTAIAGAVAGVPLVAVAPSASAASDSAWDKLAQCESSGNWAINTGNGFGGGLQFTPSTWHAFGGEGRAEDASRVEQIVVAERVLAKQGWGAWPACSRKLGLRGTTPPKFKPAPQATAATPKKVTSTGGGGSVTVVAGDTLGKIAKAHGTTVAALVSANGIANPNLLAVGDQIDLGK